MSSAKFFILTALIYTLGMSVAHGRDSEESMFMLKDALMESNADYNKHKKKQNYEEFDRADEWGARDTQAIVINGKASVQADLSDYKELKSEVERSDREVSSHDSNQDNEKFKD